MTVLRIVVLVPLVVAAIAGARFATFCATHFPNRMRSPGYQRLNAFFKEGLGRMRLLPPQTYPPALVGRLTRAMQELIAALDTLEGGKP